MRFNSENLIFSSSIKKKIFETFENNNLFNKTFFVKKTVSSPELQVYNQKLTVDDFE